MTKVDTLTGFIAGSSFLVAWSAPVLDVATNGGGSNATAVAAFFGTVGAGTLGWLVKQMRADNREALKVYREELKSEREHRAAESEACRKEKHELRADVQTLALKLAVSERENGRADGRREAGDGPGWRMKP